MFTKSFTFGLSMLLFLGGPAVAATKAIRLGKLVDGTGRVLTNAIVIVENDRIAAVTSAANTIPAGAEVVDLSRYTGIPGMIDAHTHMTYGPGAATPGTRSTIVNMVLGQDALKKRSGRVRARGPSADRGRRRLDQDLWVDGIRPGRQRISNRHI